jgi:hypothetical protein
MKKLEVMQTKCKTFATKFGFLRQHATNQVLFSKEEHKQMEDMFEDVFETYLKEKRES